MNGNRQTTTIAYADSEWRVDASWPQQATTPHCAVVIRTRPTPPQSTIGACGNHCLSTSRVPQAEESTRPGHHKSTLSDTTPLGDRGTRLSTYALTSNRQTRRAESHRPTPKTAQRCRAPQPITDSIRAGGDRCCTGDATILPIFRPTCNVRPGSIRKIVHESR